MSRVPGVPPRVATIIRRRAAEHGVSALDVLGGVRRRARARRPRSITKARWAVIADLYCSEDSAQPYSLTRIAHVLQLNPKSVWYAAICMGVHQVGTCRRGEA